MFKRIHGSVQFVRWSLDLGINLNVALETDVWKTPWHGPLFNSPHRESIPLLKMRLFLLLKIESQKCHIPYSWTFFCERDHSPSISSFFFFFLMGTQLAEDQLNVLSRSSRPLVDRACETCDVPCCYTENKSYRPDLMLPARSIAVNRFLLLMSCSCLLK